MDQGGSGLAKILLDTIEEEILRSTCKVKMENLGEKKNAVGFTAGLISGALKWDRATWDVILTTHRFALGVPDSNESGSDISIPIGNIDSVKINTPMFSKERIFEVVETVQGYYPRKISIFELPELEKWKAKIMDLKEFDRHRPKMRQRIAQELNSQEETSFDEIKDLTSNWLALAYGSLDSKNPRDVDRIIATTISDVKAAEHVQVFINKDSRSITHKNALDRRTEHVETVISANFSFGSDGAIQIQCPHCHQSDKPKSKSSQMTCSACGKQYIVPAKILSMI